ncbi:MAG: hypothetical protein AAFQ41_08825 [Cyanobacteria bacterium J06623_7]
MKAEEYLSQNQSSIQQECASIISSGAKAIITVKQSDGGYIHRVSSTEEFTQTIPDDKFFKQMRDSIRTAVVNKIVPIIVFESKQAKIISFPERFKQEV